MEDTLKLRITPVAHSSIPRDASGKRRDSRNGYAIEFSSLRELAEAAERSGQLRPHHKPEWQRDNNTIQECVDMATGRQRWHRAAEAMRFAEEAIDATWQMVADMQQETIYDLTGEAVDIGRYLDGEPECMTDYRPAPAPVFGKAVELIVSLAVSAGVNQETLIQRGVAIAALAQTLDNAGYAVKVTADHSFSNSQTYSTIRTVLKDYDDRLDMDTLTFGLAHPAMPRLFGFAIMDESCYRDILSGPFYACPENPQTDHENALVFPAMRYRGDGAEFADPVAFTRRQLEKLGLLAE